MNLAERVLKRLQESDPRKVHLYGGASKKEKEADVEAKAAAEAEERRSGATPKEVGRRMKKAAQRAGARSIGGPRVRRRAPRGRQPGERR